MNELAAGARAHRGASLAPPEQKNARVKAMERAFTAMRAIPRQARPSLCSQPGATGAFIDR